MWYLANSEQFLPLSLAYLQRLLCLRIETIMLSTMRAVRAASSIQKCIRLSSTASTLIRTRGAVHLQAKAVQITQRRDHGVIARQKRKPRPPGSEAMSEVDGASIVASSLKAHGVEYIFGVVGIPIIEIGMAAQAHGIKYVGCRNEQAAAYAAQAMGYLTGKPAVCLCVSGPGVLHTVGGLANAKVNNWPMILIGGASDADQDGRGAFQEYPTLDSIRPHVKYASRPATLEAIPSHIEKAYRTALYGKAGPTYVEIPGQLVTETIEEEYVPLVSTVPSARPVSVPPATIVTQAAELLKSAKKPLVIFGKGAAWSERGPTLLSQFITATGLPFLATPGGKGVVPDDHPLSVASARSTALKEADVILLAGARLNWMLHFGLPPRFSEDIKIIQIDINPEEFHQNSTSEVALLGDVGETAHVLRNALSGWKFPPNSPWLTTLTEKANKNRATVEKMVADHSLPLNYYAAYGAIRDFVTQNDVLVINEGANTMDIGRTMMPSVLPRRRLDAGTFGTMGVGVGYALAAGLFVRDFAKKTKVLCVEGDSAIGFSAMELETAIRYKLPVVFVVINNGGIYRGLTPEDWKDVEGDPCLNLPVLSLTPEARYDKMCEAFGGRGYFVRSVDEIRAALTDAYSNLATGGPALINVIIANDSERKQQEHDWLTRKSKL
uniref:2-hydroxyacyl-CoA lyase n=1 Tax=Panagrellus redivivus TaxID=6233 RepID=A0A7E4WDL0_PANRE